MKVISVPSRLRFATAAVLLSVPLVALETIIATRSPWWRLPYPAIRLWGLVAILFFVPFGFWMSQGKRWAFRLTVGMGALWCGLTAWLSLRSRNPSLAFFGVLLGAYWTLMYAWLRHEMQRSFFDPGLRWFQGLPRPIPSLECEIQGEAGGKVRVSRIDQDGAFLFANAPLAAFSAEGGERDLIFQFREARVSCRGVPVRTLDDRLGAGFQFLGMSPDARKDLSDFVENLRGEGHV